MKKILTIIFMASLILLVGCNTSNDDNNKADNSMNNNMTTKDTVEADEADEADMTTKDTVEADEADEADMTSNNNEEADEADMTSNDNEEADEADMTSSDTEETDDAVETDMTVFDATSLSQYNGKDGQPTYIAIEGVVYDISDEPTWLEGIHQGRYKAGQDLTEDMKNAPHGLSKLNGLKEVGTYEE